MSYLLRICISFDGCAQSLLRFGKYGVMISSRTGTAAAHGHRWGLIGVKILTKRHCVESIKNDRLRAHAVLQELSDPVVQNWMRRK